MVGMNWPQFPPMITANAGGYLKLDRCGLALAVKGVVVMSNPLIIMMIII